jgi:UDP-GlcNAc:undecaprenyl-phosphate GlcNAc-1-phosphate transferase
LIVSSRLTFRMFRRLLPASISAPGRRTLIYGAGDGGELMLRELLNNRELGLAPVGFIDDDALKIGKVIHGFRVHAGEKRLAATLAELSPEVLVISSSKLGPARFDEVQGACALYGVSIRRMSVNVELLWSPELQKATEPPHAHQPRPSGRVRRVSGSHLRIE